MNEKFTFVANELFQKICNRGPNDSEIQLFDKMRLSSKTPTQTVVSISSKYRRDLMTSNPNAAELENTYKQLDKANLKELEPFICVLHHIKKSPEIVEMLRQTCSANDSTFQANQSNSFERAKSGNKTIDSSQSNKTGVPSSINSLSGSPFLTLDFVDVTTLMLPPETIAKISTLDRLSQEKVIIKDLLYCLMGNHGIYIKALPLQSSERQFDIDGSMYPGYLDMVKSILSMCSHVSTVSRFVDEYSKYEYGNVNQALASAIDSQIKDFRLLVCQMEELFLAGDLTLSKMLNYISEPGNLMRCMSCICQDIIKFKSRGGAVLSMFYHHGLSAGSPNQKSLLNHLMKCATVPFFRILKLWIFRGIISDPYQEFFIKDNSIHSVHTIKPNDTKISATYWTNNYVIEDTLIPRFLEVHVHKILHTGKYLNVIQLCDGDTSFPDMEDMSYENEEQHFVIQIDRAYQYASKLLLNIMFNDKKLKEHLQVMKHYFLLDEADWLMHFMYTANDELNEKVSDCQLGRLDSLLDVAIQASSSATDFLDDNITVELSNQELIPFIYHIMKFDPKNRRVGNAGVIGQNMRVLEAFSLKISSEWPISLVLNDSVVQRYQILFRHIFYCHHVARVLSGVWSSNKCSSTGHFGNSYLINKASILGNHMLIFIQQLIYYMTTEVIEPFWIIFKNKLDQALNIDEILQFHEDFMQSCLLNCIGPRDMLKQLQKMMVLCINYSNRFNRLRSSRQDKKEDSFDSFSRQANTEDLSKLYDAATFESIINQDRATFTGIAKDLIATIRNEKENKMLIKLVDRLEFNGFYPILSNESDADTQ